jgi:hypothetical protein
VNSSFYSNFYHLGWLKDTMISEKKHLRLCQEETGDECNLHFRPCRRFQDLNLSEQFCMVRTDVPFEAPMKSRFVT